MDVLTKLEKAEQDEQWENQMHLQCLFGVLAPFEVASNAFGWSLVRLQKETAALFRG